MVKKLVFAAVAVVAGTVLWWFFSPESSENRAAPPLAGWMKDFTLSDAGKPAPETVILGQDGKQTHVADFRGKLVLINFWATWCAPCIREMPSLMRLQKARGGDDFTVLALSQDIRGWEMVEPFLARHDLAGLPIYIDRRAATARHYGLRMLPTSILVDRHGRELGRYAGHTEWDSPEALALVDYYLERQP